MIASLITGLLAPVLLPLPAMGAGDVDRFVLTIGDTRRADQAAAFEARRAGRILSVDQLVRRVSGQLPGWTYTGFDFEADSSGRAIYKLIFLRDGNVTWIYVDGRTGETLGRR